MQTAEFLNKYMACYEGRCFAQQYKTMAEVWEKCKRYDWLLWILEKHQPLKKQTSVRLAILFAETLIDINDDRLLLAINSAKAWLAEPTAENALACRESGEAIDNGAIGIRASRAVVYTAYTASRIADEDSARSAATAAYIVCNYGELSGLNDEICKIIREVVKNPFLTD